MQDYGVLGVVFDVRLLDKDLKKSPTLSKM